MADHPIAEVIESMEKQIADGALCFVKWTCGGCGDRVTSNDPNSISKSYLHEECGFVTTPTEINFLMMKSVMGPEQLKKALGLDKDEELP